MGSFVRESIGRLTLAYSASWTDLQSSKVFLCFRFSLVEDGIISQVIVPYFVRKLR